MKKLLVIFIAIDLISGISKAQTVKAVPNGDFETWNSTYIPQGWIADTAHDNGTDSPGAGGISRSSDHVTGNYSVKMISRPGPSRTVLTTGKIDNYSHISGGLPFNLKKDTLIGYYKYWPGSVSDTGKIEIWLQKDGNIDSTGSCFYLFSPSDSWKYFELSINSSTMPDTMRIDIFPTTIKLTTGLSLYLDDLQLKSQSHNSGIDKLLKPNFGITAFPDPAQNILNIRFGTNIPSEFGVIIFNSEGRLMIDREFNTGSSTVSLPIDQLSAGLYFYEVNTNESVVRNKFVKEYLR